MPPEGIDAHYFAVTDDVASAPTSEEAKRRGIAGDFTVFKCASAAAEDGLDIDGVLWGAGAFNAAMDGGEERGTQRRRDDVFAARGHETS